jgi:pyroglutamyl-peptidase
MTGIRLTTRETDSTTLRKILVTGFEPFAGEELNPSGEIARALEGETLAGHRVVAGVLPTAFAESLPELHKLIARHRPALVLALGQAGGRAEISLERIAINLIDARIADNAGAQPIDIAVVENAPNAYFSTLPLKAMLARLKTADIPVMLSHSAGTFVCNQTFYGLMHLLAEHHPGVPGGFVHVPYLPQQAAKHAGAPGMALETMMQGVRLCLHTALTVQRDATFSAGSIY